MSVRVVIADDHPLTVLGIRQVLSGAPDLVVVDEAGEPGALLDCLARTCCDVVVTDFAMPGHRHADGLLMLEAIRAAFPQVRLVVLTMLDNPALLQHIRDAGALAVVGKRSDLDELPRAIMAAYHGRSYSTASVHATYSAAVDADSARPLSPREIEIVRLCANGMTMTDIALHFDRSIKTISTHKHNAMDKLGINNDAELFHYAVSNGLA
ncbi:response regulator transcription factor [Burkholderia pseudomultivorans]|uniref:LuxR family transcriptional regulator n=1 Tax=Burkholderia pseudomultivorans TaxID=1207504 RepID=A0A132E5B4_9BURK|nr:response regulator transcription factor [Burkholderia pseudomultivorans]KWF16654.1 LuxR family transcriptional regulator [Burkholderia pseudomultivorans]